MPILLTHEAKLTLGIGAALCESRTLAHDRFFDTAILEANHGPHRQNHLRRILERKALPELAAAWRQYLLTEIDYPINELVFAELRGRLLLNRSIGLPENAGLCLERLGGHPLIPGSAVRGCARRMAIQRLLDETDAAAKAELLWRIARVFGWRDSDWRDDSDLAWACGSSWETVARDVQSRLQQRLAESSPSAPTVAKTGLPSCAGTVQFLPAHPWHSPEPDLELDVALNHHHRTGQSQSASADFPEPSREHFLAVAPGHLFVFAVMGESEGRLWARAWLREGLAMLGLGGRTGAGYGWFDTSEELQQVWLAKINQEQEVHRRRLAAENAELQRQLDTEARQRAAEDLEKARKSMTPAQLEDFKITQLSEEQFRGKLQTFPRHVDDKKMWPEQQAIVRALRQDRLPAWEDLKQRAQKGGPWAQAEQAIRLAAKKANLGKMP